ncbi:MAG TPA: NAD(P)-dependent oxidoreductase [Acidimicrobiales bacterium]|nr:NAD(P)-dependent oxidoreductase [Acidimicrobiales bacterium]
MAEVTFCNSISVAEHAVMQILALVRNFLPSYDWITKGGWNIAYSVERAYDLEGMDVGILAAGRIGLAVLRRLAPFDVQLHYSQRHRLSPEVERELALTFHSDTRSLAQAVDVVSIHSPRCPRRTACSTRAAQLHEAGLLHRQYRPRCHHGPRRGRPSARVRAAGRLCRRRLVSAAPIG